MTSASQANSSSSEREFVTLKIADQLFGVEVTEIHDVFQPQAITLVPLAQREIAGVLNLRGRIVTTICARRRLGLPERPQGAPPPMAVGVEKDGDSYALLVDSVDEVMKLAESAYEAVPVNLDPRWAHVSRGIYRVDGGLLVALDVERLLDLGVQAAA